MKKIEIKFGKDFIKILFEYFNTSDNPYALKLMDLKIFDKFRSLQFNEETKGSTFEKLVDEIPLLRENEKTKKLLLNRYAEYSKCYESLLKEYQKSKNSHEERKRAHVGKTIQIGNQLKEFYHQRDGSKISPI